MFPSEGWPFPESCVAGQLRIQTSSMHCQVDPPPQEQLETKHISSKPRSQFRVGKCFQLWYYTPSAPRMCLQADWAPHLQRLRVHNILAEIEILSVQADQATHGKLVRTFTRVCVYMRVFTYHFIRLFTYIYIVLYVWSNLFQPEVLRCALSKTNQSNPEMD